MSCSSAVVIRAATALVSSGASSFMPASWLAIVADSCSPAGRSAIRVRISLGQRQLPAQVVRLAGADSEVGADGGEAVLVVQAGAGLPAVAELLLLVDEGEVLAGVVDLRLDPAHLLGRGRVVEQQHDQASDRLEALVALGAAQLVALDGRQVAPLAVIEDDGLVLAGAVADARHELAGSREHRGEAVDAFG